MMSTKWGILGAGKISHDFVTSVQSLESRDHTFVAVGACDLTRAQDFAKLHKISKAYGSYEELAKDPDVEVIYIGTINTAHYSAAKLMLEHGKHILMEKPFTLNTKNTKEVFALAKQKKLFAMEALSARFMPSYEFVFDQINGGVIGEIREVHVYNYQRNEDGKPNNLEDFGSRFLSEMSIDIHTSINIVEQVFSFEKPGNITRQKYPTKNVSELDFIFTNDRSASIYPNSQIDLPYETIIKGKKGQIQIEFESKQTVKVHTCLYKQKLNNFTGHGKIKVFHYTVPISNLKYGNTGFCYQVNEVRKCIKAGLLESTHMSHENSIMISKIKDYITENCSD